MRRLTLLGLIAGTLLIHQARAQGAAADSGRVAPPPLLPAFRVEPLRAPRNPALAPGGRLGPFLPAALVAATWERELRDRLPRGFDVGGLAATVVSPGALSQPSGPPSFQGAARSGVFGPYADLQMQLAVRFELKADRFRNLQCNAIERQQAISGCNPGFPTITPNPQYKILTSGVVGRRLHVNVDFDSQREYDSNNNLKVWYEGLEDEVLRRVEAGNVTFQAPPSRFISAAIPANNFGVQAIAQVGPVEFRGIYAQQKGNVVKDRLYSVGETTSQPIDHVARDLDYEAGRFFFTVDPRAIPGAPAIDILSLSQAALPDSLQVGGLHVYRVRAVAPGTAGNQNIGGVHAVACGVGTQSVDCGAERVGPFQWEILQEGKDYYVDPSGAWFALVNRLDQSDYLAVSYVPPGQPGCPGARPCVGTFPTERNIDTTSIDTLRLVYDPRPGVTAASPAFRFEIRNAYRVGGQEIDRTSVQLKVTINQREQAVLTKQTYLQLLGLAVSNDPNSFDQFNRLFPRTRDPQQGAPLRDYFVIFPHLTPFADSTKLTAPERNDSLYRTPRGLLATQGPPSVLTLVEHANASASADRSVLSLNSFQIRDGSEKIYVGNTLLTRGTDYTIDYTTGQVQFRNADSLFQGGLAQVRAQFEERSAFDASPTSIFGLAARYDLGTVGSVNATGLFQRQQSAFTRPPLGLEPSSSFVGGLSTTLRFQPDWLTTAVDALPAVHTEAPSFINVAAEVAVSKPSPNQVGQAYIEEFEDQSGRFINLGETAWHWGSIPTSTRGATPFGIPVTGFDTLDAAFLTWQSLPIHLDGTPVQFFPQQIDPTIVLVGQAQSAEPVLWMMLKPDTVLGLANSNTGAPNWVKPHRVAPRWRSISQTLSATGIDLSRVEYLEFWVWEDGHRTAKQNNAALLLDFGSVYEDALAFVPTSFSTDTGDTVYAGQRTTGLGRLDSERDPITQSWNAAVNDEGILADRITDGILNSTTGQVIDTLPLCDATVRGQLQTYLFGDLRSRCGRHNGAIDTEDQDGDAKLDSVVGVKTREDFVRFVFPIGDERYYVRDGVMFPDPAGGASGWRLYRIPFRTDTLLQGQPNLRQIQSLRLTVVVPPTVPAGAPDPQIYFALSRVQLVGATWLKRAETPIAGIGGSRGTGFGSVIASVVSTENHDLGYTPPPGVFDQASRRDAGFQLGTTQINERSLRLLATGIERGQHAEAFERFTTEGDKNFLKYRKLRLWARGRGPGWEDGDLEFYIKVGKDENNFYLYHTPARADSWDPEVVADFSRWLGLRARIEQRWLLGDTAQVYSGCPDTTVVPHDTAYVMCDGPYIAHIRDPGIAPPNLAAVQEIATGIVRVRSTVFIDQAELWVDDIRLSDVVDDAGMAGAVDLTVTAANFADLALSISSRDAQFRQLGEDPTYVADNALSLGSTVRLERLLPDRWGLAMPFTVRHTTTTSAPFYLAGTDLRADALAGLRTPTASASSYALLLRRVRQSTGTAGRLLLDPFSFSATYIDGTATSSLSHATNSNFVVNADYNLAPAAVRMAGIRVTPTGVRFHSGLIGSDAERLTYLVPVARPTDSLLTPLHSFGRAWRNSASLDLQPVTAFQVRADLQSQRDLRHYGDSTTMGRLAEQGRGRLLGRDIGLETQRSLNTFVSYTPLPLSWLRPRASLSTTFNLSRDPNAPSALRDLGDTAGAFHLPLAFSNAQRLDAGLRLDPKGFAGFVFGDSARLAHLLARVTNLDLAYSRTRSSTFGQVGQEPGSGYQLTLTGFGALLGQGGALATAALDNSTVSAASGALLPLGVRLNALYQRVTGVSWLLHTNDQVPIRQFSREWPSGVMSWTFSPRGGLLRQLVTSLSAQVAYRRRLTASEQPTFSGTGQGTSVSTLDRMLAPTVSLTWVHGVLTGFDQSVTHTEQISAGNAFRSRKAQQNANVAFAFRPPSGIMKLRSDIRTTFRYSVMDNNSCLKIAGQGDCVPYVDSRVTATQLTMDTDFPPSLSAGFQMAYTLDDERQAFRKVSQLTITAFVQLNTSVGQIR